MKKLLFLLFFAYSISNAQVPQKMSHRGTAYNTSGQVLINTPIIVRVKIFDGNTTGTLIFQETHNNTTNQNGQYSIEIGNGTNQSALFNSINWGTNNQKWLEIGIATASNPTNFVTGSSQLMSVPYALYAENTVNNNGIEIVNNINFLINNIKPIDNKIVYVKGYFNEGDGGEGFFIFIKNNQKTTNLGTIFSSPIIQTDNTTTGRWIRQYSGYMNVEFFGVQRDWESPYSGFSNSDRIQNMIDYATTDANTIYSHEADLTIYFPNGQYFIDKPLILKDRVKLLGSPGTLLTNKGDSYDYMFKINSGPVTNLRMENLNINLNGQPNVGGIHIKATLSTENNPGGLWDANFKNIRILKANGIGIFLEGGEDGSGGNLPNQFMIFENVRVYRNTSNHYALKITGENANYSFVNCEFLNTPYTNYGGGCIYIGSQKSAIPNTNKVGSNAISFINSGFGGNTAYGAIIENSGNITFDTCFFEGTDYAFTVKNSEQINILRSRFANASGSGSLSSSHTNHVGRIIVAENSIVNIESNRIVVSYPSEINYPYNLDNQKFIEGVGNNNVINAKNNSFSFSALGNSSGIMQSVNLNLNRVYLWSKKLVYINVPSIYNSLTNDLNIINSDINAAENFYLRANGGILKINAMTTTTPIIGGKNIYLNGKNSITLDNGQIATFIKIDNAGGNIPPTYQLVSISY